MLNELRANDFLTILAYWAHQILKVSRSFVFQSQDLIFFSKMDQQPMKFPNILRCFHGFSFKCKSCSQRLYYLQSTDFTFC